MIRRDLSDGSCLMIPQEQHADVSAQFAARMSDDRRTLPHRAQPVRRQQHLVLTAAPRSSGVYVEREHPVNLMF